MEKTEILIADPQPLAVPTDRMRISAGQDVNGNEPAIIEIGSPTRCDYPNPPSVVLKEGIHIIVRQSNASLMINRGLPVIPSVQAIIRAKPDAAVVGCQ